MKATATVGRTVRPLPGPGALRESVLAVRSVLDPSGNSLRAIAVKVQVRGNRRWKVLDCLQLINGNTDQLAHLCFEIDPSDPIDGPGLKQLGRDLRRAAKRPLLLLGGEGYRQIDLNGVVSECFVWRNKIHWISEAPAIRVIAPVADSCGAPPASCTVEAWNREVGSKFRGNHYMIVMFGAALSAPLRRLLDSPPQLSRYSFLVRVRREKARHNPPFNRASCQVFHLQARPAPHSGCSNCLVRSRTSQCSCRKFDRWLILRR